MSEESTSTSRRSFLGLGIAAAGSAAATAIPAVEPDDKTDRDGNRKPRQAADHYSETDHIRTAYARMRF